MSPPARERSRLLRAVTILGAASALAGSVVDAAHAEPSASSTAVASPEHAELAETASDAPADTAAANPDSAKLAAPENSKMAAAPDPEKQNQTQVAEPPIPGSRAPKPEAQPEGQSLPTGQDKSGVTSQAISIPKGSGTIKGMDESFSAQLSTGIATLTVPIALPSARGGAQPALSLAYSSSHGFGLAGVG